jgi:O-antigen/teichoic acid export membrane protein
MGCTFKLIALVYILSINYAVCERKSPPLPDAVDGKKLTGGRLLVKNIVLNYGFQALNILLGIIAVPIIIHHIGDYRWGILSLVWSIIGYYSFLDLGLGRGLTQIVSKKLGLGQTEIIPTVVWSGFSIAFLLGALGGLAIYLSSHFIVTQFLKIEPAYYQETLDAMHYLALTMPFLIGIFALKGVLESYQKFNYLTLLRIPIFLSNYVIPMFLVAYTQNLGILVLVIALGRMLTFFLHFFFCLKTIPALGLKPLIKGEQLKELFSFGSWVTVSNIVNPFMTYMDRTLISYFLSPRAVAYYATPFDVITRTKIIPEGILSVMFPALTAEFKQDIPRAKKLYLKSLFAIMGLMAIPIAVIVLFAHPLISMWISVAFANKSALLAQLIAINQFIIAINQVPFSVIQSIGRSDITAIIHLIEFPLYLFSLAHFTKQYGIVGACLASLVRVILDTVLMHTIAMRLINGLQPKTQKEVTTTA